MRLERTIHPVGQGGFYTEHLVDENQDFFVVYDCGGNSKPFMERYLSDFIRENTRGGKMIIDALFISHLHADHINGLRFLLEMENVKVKYLFLPQLTDDLLAETLMFNAFQNHENVQELTDFILSLYGESSGRYHETRIVQVEPYREQDNRNSESQNNSVDINNINISRDIRDIENLSLIKSGTRLTTGTPWWYIPYNLRVKKKKKKGFYKYLIDELRLDRLDYSRMPDVVQGYGISRLKGVYKDYFGNNHNSYSMTLFSGMRDPSCYKIKRCHHVWNLNCYTPYHVSHESPNCLYTGDFEAQTYYDDMKQFYGSLWPTIESIQVPHHGSMFNLHQPMYKNAIRGFISVGKGNKYHHPHKMTLIELYNNGCLPIVVTEDDRTKFVSYYSF